MDFSNVRERRKLLGRTLTILGVMAFLGAALARADDWVANTAGKNASPAPDIAAKPGSPMPMTPPLPPPDVTIPVSVPPGSESQTASPLPNPVDTDYEDKLQEEDGTKGSKKLTLQECLDLAFENQPALQAAQFSYSGAYNAWRGLNELSPLVGVLARDLKIRKQQACLGIQIAQAALMQAQWDTRYAVTRNYFSVVYARQQSALVQRVVDKLDRAHKRAVELVKAGDPKIVINQIDVENLYIAREKTRARGLEASIGVRKAMAALHEAIGVKHDFPLDVADAKLPDLVSDLQMSDLIAKALSQRGEMSQAELASVVTSLEVDAQRRLFFKSRAPTWASGADPHAAVIPQGISNTTYRPGAIPPEMPANLFGPRWVRMERASAFCARAGAVVDKTENLITLEAKVAYWKWKEASEALRIYQGDPAEKPGRRTLAEKAEWIYSQVAEDFHNGKISGETYLKARGAADQAQVDYNEAVYHHALALAGLERITAGGYRLAAPQP